ncbi:hypothetical protein ACUY4R_003850 [Kosakonia sp. BK9b]|uniref:hypothetical protein n=1 Tax=Kosakonia sp. TaxID=1916651 RepID=UPI00289F508C|nr:hypothetical protein [Kosakonia sp.]
MRKKYGEHRYVHFICNGLTGFIEVEPCGGMWVSYAGERRGYGGLQGRLKHVVDHIMQQHGLMHH